MVVRADWSRSSALRFARTTRDDPPAPATTPNAPQPSAESSTPATRPSAVASSTARARHTATGAYAAHQLHQRFAETTRAVAANFEVFSGGDDHVTREDLERVRDGRAPGATEEMRARARFILDSPSFMNALDVGAGRGDVDGKISREDLRGAQTQLEGQNWSGPTIGVDGAIDSEAEARAVLDRYGLLADTADGKGGANGHVSNDDVRALLNDPNIPDELRAAAEYIDGGVKLPDDGSSFLGTLTSPARAGGGWLVDRAGDAGGALANETREHALGTSSLDDQTRADLEDAARVAARDTTGSALPLNEQQNAHRTNTPEELQEGLQGDYQWLEGDIRRSPAVMAHDWQSSNGLSLHDWLELGGASGKGLKLDIKESRSIDSVIEELHAADLPGERLILNADVMRGPGGRSPSVTVGDLEKLRAEFPDATIAIGAKTGRTAEGTTYSEAQVSEMIAIAERVGGPVMFPLRAELVTPQIVERLSAHGTVAIWNDPSTHPLGTPAAVQAEAQRFRDMGVTGLIDLRP